jgi:glucosamine 6-phosphate synthetase-like amidotransferase/phosphosugar isomerase protein
MAVGHPLRVALEVIPLRFLAYHFAVRNARDVDHPRHLVKAVVSE